MIGSLPVNSLCLGRETPRRFWLLSLGRAATRVHSVTLLALAILSLAGLMRADALVKPSVGSQAAHGSFSKLRKHARQATVSKAGRQPLAAATGLTDTFEAQSYMLRLRIDPAAKLLSGSVPMRARAENLFVRQLGAG